MAQRSSFITNGGGGNHMGNKSKGRDMESEASGDPLIQPNP